jgi:hypothetical protein
MPAGFPPFSLARRYFASCRQRYFTILPIFFASSRTLHFFISVESPACRHRYAAAATRRLSSQRQRRFYVAAIRFR